MKKNKKSPFLLDKPLGTIPKRTQSIYIKELFDRSEKAIERLKELLK